MSDSQTLSRCRPLGRADQEPQTAPPSVAYDFQNLGRSPTTGKPSAPVRPRRVGSRSGPPL
jgi:hypothetical protein